MASLEEILNVLYSPTTQDRDLISRAYIFAEQLHKDQKRLSGEPYFSHLTETAKILAEYGMEPSTIAAGLLHDSIEDTSLTANDLSQAFGNEICFLVEGVTKLGHLRYQGADRHNESLRKLFVAMSQDIRVLMIKLADRLHNMRTLNFVPVAKQKRIATETLEIYAPIAYRLGIRKLSRELEDLAFPYVYPKEYAVLEKAVKTQYDENVESLEKFLRSLKKALAKEGVSYIRTEYRVKGVFSLFKKLQLKKKHIDEVHDILALRIIVPEIAQCYQVLGVVHGIWRPLPRRIKDYIAFPKPNGYQAIHTTVFTGDGNVVEVQIKTEAMQEHSEYGIASHISYKGDARNVQASHGMKWVEDLLPKQKNLAPWIQDLAEYQKHSKNETFKEDLTSDFFHYRMFVFSPKGDVVDLPNGSTPIDFAYSIHSDIGDHLFGAKVNGKLVSLDTPLHNGNIVEIIRKPGSKPSPKWIEYAKTTSAKRHIRIALQKLKKKSR